MRSFEYRADIDGLRAISILSVLLFHAHVAGFRGGFVGVDIFFVISGYLITSILITRDDAPVGQRLKDFYLRRSRRILPALLAMLAVTTPIAVLLLGPKELVSYGRYLSLTSVLLTNVAAWTDHSGGWPPLVHLWSIAVEEQFYIAYPLLLFGVLRAGRMPSILLVTALTGASFALCVWTSYSAPTANLYLSPTRGWELLLGALLALGRAPVWGRTICELLSVLSLVIIATCVHVYSHQVRYPGASTVLPCLAACALLVSGRDHRTMVSRLLSLRPVVFTGLISYSLYLWHVPIFALFWYQAGGRPTAMRTVIALVASVLAAVASWLLVERPLRSKMWLNSNRRFLVVTALTNATFGVIGLVLWLHGTADASRITNLRTMMSGAAH